MLTDERSASNKPASKPCWQRSAYTPPPVDIGVGMQQGMAKTVPPSVIVEERLQLVILELKQHATLSEGPKKKNTIGRL